MSRHKSCGGSERRPATVCSAFAPFWDSSILLEVASATLSPMDIAQWWPKLESSTQKWLVDNNGDTIPPHVIVEIAAAGGPGGGLSDTDLSDGGLSDADVDWVEAVANEETPNK